MCAWKKREVSHKRIKEGAYISTRQAEIEQHQILTADGTVWTLACVRVCVCARVCVNITSCCLS